MLGRGERSAARDGFRVLRYPSTFVLAPVKRAAVVTRREYDPYRASMILGAAARCTRRPLAYPEPQGGAFNNFQATYSDRLLLLALNITKMV